MIAEMQCKSCVFWEQDPNWKTHGSCHRHAPTLIPRSDNGYLTHKSEWPPVSDNRGCGDHTTLAEYRYQRANMMKA